ncbi:MAG: M48 family metalloprotease, partial [Bdellovibrionota bacterium]
MNRVFNDLSNAQARILGVQKIENSFYFIESNELNAFAVVLRPKAEGESASGRIYLTTGLIAYFMRGVNNENYYDRIKALAGVIAHELGHAYDKLDGHFEDHYKGFGAHAIEVRADLEGMRVAEEAGYPRDIVYRSLEVARTMMRGAQSSSAFSSHPHTQVRLTALGLGQTFMRYENASSPQSLPFARLLEAGEYQAMLAETARMSKREIEFNFGNNLDSLLKTIDAITAANVSVRHPELRTDTDIEMAKTLALLLLDQYLEDAYDTDRFSEIDGPLVKRAYTKLNSQLKMPEYAHREQTSEYLRSTNATFKNAPKLRVAAKHWSRLEFHPLYSSPLFRKVYSKGQPLPSEQTYARRYGAIVSAKPLTESDSATDGYSSASEFESIRILHRFLKNDFSKLLEDGNLAPVFSRGPGDYHFTSLLPFAYATHLTHLYGLRPRSAEYLKFKTEIHEIAQSLWANRGFWAFYEVAANTSIDWKKIAVEVGVDIKSVSTSVAQEAKKFIGSNDKRLLQMLRASKVKLDRPRYRTMYRQWDAKPVHHILLPLLEGKTHDKSLGQLVHAIYFNDLPVLARHLRSRFLGRPPTGETSQPGRWKDFFTTFAPFESSISNAEINRLVAEILTQDILKDERLDSKSKVEQLLELAGIRKLYWDGGRHSGEMIVFDWQKPAARVIEAAIRSVDPSWKFFDWIDSTKKDIEYDIGDPIIIDGNEYHQHAANREHRARTYFDELVIEMRKEASSPADLEKYIRLFNQSGISASQFDILSQTVLAITRSSKFETRQVFRLFNVLTEKHRSVSTDVLFQEFLEKSVVPKKNLTQRILSDKRIASLALQAKLAAGPLREAEEGAKTPAEVVALVTAALPDASSQRDELLEKLGWRLGLSGEDLKLLIEHNKSTNWKNNGSDPIWLRLASAAASFLHVCTDSEKLVFLDYLLRPTLKSQSGFQTLLRFKAENDTFFKTYIQVKTEDFLTMLDRFVHESSPMQKLPLVDLTLTSGDRNLLKRKTRFQELAKKYLGMESDSKELILLETWLEVIPQDERGPTAAYFLAHSEKSGNGKSLALTLELLQTVGKKLGQMAADWDIFGSEHRESLQHLKDRAKPLTKIEIENQLRATL